MLMERRGGRRALSLGSGLGFKAGIGTLTPTVDKGGNLTLLPRGFIACLLTSLLPRGLAIHLVGLYEETAFIKLCPET